MTLIIQIWMKVTVVNIIQNWMTLIILIRMKVKIVSIFQNWMTFYHPDLDESNTC